jgi:hypothetical protein
LEKNMPETIIKQLKKPWKVGGQTVTEIEVRPATMKDVCEAEQASSAFQPNSFSVQMASLQLVRAGDTFTGPFVAGHFTAMRPAQFAEVTAALQEANNLGEDE